MKDCTDLVIRFQRGDRTALGALAAEIQEDLFHLLVSRLRNTADAEDALQETLRQIVASLSDLRDPRAFAGWVYRIALDKARHLRRAGAAELKTMRGAALRASGERGGTAMNTVEAAEVRAKVADAVAGLEEELQLAVRLRYEHELTQAQMAQAMNLPETTVGRRLQAAHARLRELLAGAGVALALVALEGELRAAERHPLPPVVAEKLRRIAREEAGRGGRAVGQGRGGRRRLVGGLAMLALLGLMVWWAARPSGGGGSGGVAATAGTGAPATARGDANAEPAEERGEENEKAPAAEEPGTGRAEGAKSGEGPASEPSAALTGHVRDEVTGAPIVGATVWLERKHRRVAESSTDAEGAFAFRVEPGEYAVFVVAPGYVGPQVAYDFLENEWMEGPLVGDRLPPPKNRLALRPDHVTLAEGRTAAVELPLGTGVEVRGRVVDAAGRPVAGAEVEFAQLGPEGAKAAAQFWTARDFGYTGVEKGRAAEFLRTGADGRFMFPAVFRRGELIFDIRAAGFRQLHKRVRLRDDAIDISFTMGACMTAGGVVVDHEGHPVPGATVHFQDPARDPDERGVFYLPHHDPKTDAQGRFRYEDVAEGSHLACAMAPGHGYAIVDFRGMNPLELRIALPRCDRELAGLVRDTAGKPIARAQVSVYDLQIEEGTLRGHLMFDNPGMFEETEKPGDFTLGFAPREEFPTPSTRTSKSGEFKLKNLPLGPGRPLILQVTTEHGVTRVRVEKEGWVEVVVD